MLWCKMPVSRWERDIQEAYLTCSPPFALTYWNMSPPLAYSMEMARYSGVKNTCISEFCFQAHMQHTLAFLSANSCRACDVAGHLLCQSIPIPCFAVQWPRLLADPTHA